MRTVSWHPTLSTYSVWPVNFVCSAFSASLLHGLPHVVHTSCITCGQQQQQGMAFYEPAFLNHAAMLYNAMVEIIACTCTVQKVCSVLSRPWKLVYLN